MVSRTLAPISAIEIGSVIISLPQRLDLASEFVVLAVEVVVDRHHPAVVGVELGAQRRGSSCGVLADFVHALEIRHAFLAAQRLALLEVEVDPGRDISDQRELPS